MPVDSHAGDGATRGPQCEGGMTDDEITEEHIALMKDVLIQHVPHARALGMNVVNAKRS